MTDNQINPLVSVPVLTYNSGKFILETLESVQAQTYQNIELIVSDDCSTDNTIEICKNWIKSNRDRFVETKVLESATNTGIPANKNRALAECKGEWIKGIAGDDALIDTAISDYIDFVKKDSNIRIVFAYSYRYNQSFAEDNFITRFPRKFPLAFAGTDSNINVQLGMLLKANKINAPTIFYQRAIIEAVGGYDERFKLLEDYPMWIKLSKAGYKFHFMPKVTVKHRFHDQALNSNISRRLYNLSYFNKDMFREIYIYPNLSKIDRINEKYKIRIRKSLNYLGLNINKPWIIAIDQILTKYMNPFSYISYIYWKVNIQE